MAVATSDHVAVTVGPSTERLQFGDVTLVPDERLVLRKGQPVALTPKAFDLLLLLAENPGRLLTKEQMMQAVWRDTAVEESNLSYHVFAIRKVLGDTAGNGQLIETVKRTGYRFTAAVTRLNGSVNPASASPVSDAGSAGSVPETRRNNRVVWRPAAWFLAGVLIAGGGAVLFNMRQTDALPRSTRMEISPGVRLAEASAFAISPDGRLLVYAGTDADGVTRLWLRDLDGSPRPLLGTETALGALTPPMFWSPDSRTIAFDAAGQLKRFDLRDGATRTVCSLPGLAVGGSENVDGVVIVGQPNGGLYRCSDGRSSELTRLDPSNGETAHAFPWFLPDGRHFLYVRIARKAPEGSGVYIGSLDDGPDAPRRERLLASGFGAAYVPMKGTSIGNVIFLRDTTLLAQAFDERSLRLRGDEIQLASPVGSFLDGGFFSVSANDVIAFRPPDRFQLTWLNREGQRTGTVGKIGRYSKLDISPDDSSVAVSRETVGSNIDQDVWIFGISRDTEKRVTFGSLLEDAPVYLGNGERLVFTISGDVGTLFEEGVDGPPNPRLLLGKNLHHKIPTSASRDGTVLLFTELSMSRSRSDVWALPLTGGGKAFPLIQGELDQDQAQLSPDGRLVAYASNDSGKYEVLVRRFKEPGASPYDPQTTPVSNGGGNTPRWGRGGRELYFITADGQVMVADVNAGVNITAGEPRVLFRLPGTHGDWDVVSDGSRFLIALPAGADASSPFQMLTSHLASLRSRR